MEIKLKNKLLIKRCILCQRNKGGVQVDIEYLINAYNKLSQVFDNVRIKFYLDNGESFDMTIEELRDYINK